MNGYCCDDCGAVFQFPTIIDEITWEEFQGQRGRHEQRTLACPECESYQVEETRLCDKCKEDRSLDGFDYCFACLPEDILADDMREVLAAMTPDELARHTRMVK